MPFVHSLQSVSTASLMPLAVWFIILLGYYYFWWTTSARGPIILLSHRENFFTNWFLVRIGLDCITFTSTAKGENHLLKITDGRHLFDSIKRLRLTYQVRAYTEHGIISLPIPPPLNWIIEIDSFYRRKWAFDGDCSVLLCIATMVSNWAPDPRMLRWQDDTKRLKFKYRVKR